MREEGDGPGDRAGTEELLGMVDITFKPQVFRRATAAGSIRLKESTIEAVRRGDTKKGDPLATARLAAILAVKETPRLIPFCHPIPITALEVGFELEEMRVKATVTVTSLGRTGVEMEALAGVSAALLNIWDMIKYLEKDESGNYPETAIEEIRVLEKMKEE
ncbi:MAG: cyclic pyranopterin monophosphate synthase MoaC [Methanothrix sp.]|jgi:cyclic pyranopterin phosphate synthase|uniref:cyclic pyranopterin monophosphate synthase MoaC n=1 Tax=Methanothrix sp. TaxID=90426 RepID=UPI0025D14592|nr:cyclic pyranopterin monophosphate synthase MoaC [Methanothrix sp.]HPW72280.1 cyclic pyranopterin monophosphate synthase MoaC [Methanothrix sp.]